MRTSPAGTLSSLLARRSLGSLAATAGFAAAIVGTNPTAQAAYEDATMDLPRHTSPYAGVGPYRPYVQEILIAGVVPLKDEALLNRTAHGYLFRAGQQDSDLTVTYTNGRLRFVDKGTESWKWRPKACTKIAVPVGVGASCAVRSKFTHAAPMLVEVWPRLGNDTLDSTALPALFDVSFLGDRGRDVAYLGAGNDFFNGAQDADLGHGGGGRDWVRTGLDDDVIDGGAGGDYLVGVDGHDTIAGGAGNDRLFGIDGNDELFAGTGDDYVNCGDGDDEATSKYSDKTVDCETTHAS
jgi:Ca2+-binding RTX toxin-like protein